MIGTECQEYLSFQVLQEANARKRSVGDILRGMPIKIKRRAEVGRERLQTLMYVRYPWKTREKKDNYKEEPQILVKLGEHFGQEMDRSIPRISSVQFSRSVVSDSLRPHELQHVRPPCPLPTPRVHSDSHPSSQWCHPAISSSVIPLSSCPQSLPASESFPMSQLFTRGGQSTGVSALALFLPKKSQGWSPSEWVVPFHVHILISLVILFSLYF